MTIQCTDKDKVGCSCACMLIHSNSADNENDKRYKANVILSRISLDNLNTRWKDTVVKAFSTRRREMPRSNEQTNFVPFLPGGPSDCPISNASVFRYGPSDKPNDGRTSRCVVSSSVDGDKRLKASHFQSTGATVISVNENRTVPRQ